MEEVEGAFDKLWEDNEEFQLGTLKGLVLPLPGHTPDHVGYQIGNSVYAGDTIFLVSSCIPVILYRERDIDL